MRAVCRVLILAVAAAVAGATAACSGPATSAPGPQASVSGSWPAAGHDIGDTRDAAGEHIIGPGNASRLTMAWRITAAGVVADTPTEYDGVVYFTDEGGKLWAVAGGSGRVLWSDEVSGYTGFPAVSRTSPAVYGNELVLGDTSAPGHGAYVFAVSRRTGTLLWRTQVDTNPAAIITSSPVLYRGVAYLGVSSDEEALAAEPGYHCCTFRGSVVTLNARTGRLLWKTYTVPPGYTGAAVWGSTPAINPADNLVYVGTGDNYSVPVGVCTVPGQEGCAPLPAGDHVDSVLALDLRTGAIRWSRPTLTSDVFTDECGVQHSTTCGPDFDFGNGPNLIRLPSGRELLGIGQKSGVYWALNPRTGTVVWHTKVGPGSALGGMLWGSATDGRHIYVAIGNLAGVPYRITSASGQQHVVPRHLAFPASRRTLLGQQVRDRSGQRPASGTSLRAGAGLMMPHASKPSASTAADARPDPAGVPEQITTDAIVLAGKAGCHCASPADLSLGSNSPVAHPAWHPALSGQSGQDLAMRQRLPGQPGNARRNLYSAQAPPRSEPDHQAMVVISGKNGSALPGARRRTSLPALIQPAWEPDTKMTC